MTDSQKTAVIFGLANKRSIAWAIAQKLHEAGWRLAITYQNERLEQEAKDLITDLPGAAGLMCDVSSDEQIAKLFEELKSRYGVLHGIVQRGVRSGGGIEGRIREHHAGRISHRARHQRIFARRRGTRGRSTDDLRRRYRHDDLLRR
jgi:short-subunit dehydrogenase